MIPQWTYEFPLPMADLRTDPAAIPYQYASDLVGVDGRKVGSLDRFPGFRQVTAVTGIDPSTTVGGCSSGFSSGFWRTSTLDFFKYAEVQKGTTTTILSGFLVRIGYTVTFYYYDPSASTWSSVELSDTSSGEIDATFGGKFIWLVNSRTYGTSAWWDDETGDWIVVRMGHRGIPAAITDTSASTTNGAIIQADILTSTIYYRVAYRLLDSRRRLASPIREVTITDTTPVSDFCLHGRFTVDADDAAAYDTVEIFRSINMGANLYREVYHHVPTETGIPTATLADLTGDGSPGSALGSSGGTISFVLGGTSAAAGGTTYYLRGTLNDTVLSQQLDQFDPVGDEAGDVPIASRIYYADGVNYLVGDDTTNERCAGDIRYSRTDLLRPEVFPGLNLYPMPRVSDKVQRFLRAGDFLFGVARNRLFRLSRIGTLVAGERISHGWGLVSPYACTEVGTDLAIVGPSTMVLVTGSTGQHVTVGILERVLTHAEEWRGRSESVFAVYDSRLACLFIVNPETEDAVCVWGTTNTVTRLRDMNFVYGTAGPVPGLDGPDQAFFITANGIIVRPDLDEENTKQTQLGVDGTVNGTFTAPNDGTTLTDMHASFASTLQDCYLYVRPGLPTETRVKILSNTGTTLTVETEVTVETGDGYSISPVPFEWVGSSLGAPSDPTLDGPRDLFHRRKVEAIGVHWGEIEGETESASAVVGVRESPYDDDLVTDTIGMTPNEPDECFGAVSAARPLLFPFVRCVTSNLPLKLRAVMVNGALEGTMES